MKTTYIKYFAFAALCFVLHSCEIEKSEKPRPGGTGITILKDAVHVVEDYAWFAKASLAALHYSKATTGEKIILENSIFDGYKFRQIDDAWEVEIFYEKYYVSFFYDDDRELSDIDVTRLRDYDESKKPLFDTCYMQSLPENKWNLVIHNVQEPPQYGTIRGGKGQLTLEAKGKDAALPDTFEVSGIGTYISSDHQKKVVEAAWTIESGTYECFQTGYHRNLLRAFMKIECGLPGGKKDMVEAVFDRSVPKLELKLNGRVEEASPYF